MTTTSEQTDAEFLGVDDVPPGRLAPELDEAVNCGQARRAYALARWEESWRRSAIHWSWRNEGRLNAARRAHDQRREALVLVIPPVDFDAFLAEMNADEAIAFSGAARAAAPPRAVADARTTDPVRGPSVVAAA